MGMLACPMEVIWACWATMAWAACPRGCQGLSCVCPRGLPWLWERARRHAIEAVKISRPDSTFFFNDFQKPKTKF